MTRILTAQEVSQHALRKDGWLIIHGHVFDVSSFMVRFPSSPISQT